MRKTAAIKVNKNKQMVSVSLALFKERQRKDFGLLKADKSDLCLSFSLISLIGIFCFSLSLQNVAAWLDFCYFRKSRYAYEGMLYSLYVHRYLMQGCDYLKNDTTSSSSAP